jgi:hypothetical protein
MKPSNEKISNGKHHTYSREKGYVETPYVKQEYPKWVDGKLVQAPPAAPAEVKK